MSITDDIMTAARSGNIQTVNGLLARDASLVTAVDGDGATALHYAALYGHRDIVRLLAERGGDINRRDEHFDATPTGWAIRYARELGGLLGTELDDFEFAIRSRDVHWIARFIARRPALRDAADRNGTPFRELAEKSGDPAVLALWDDGEPD